MNKKKDSAMLSDDYTELKKSISILCVEDEMIIMESLKIVLKRRFDTIYTASNGKNGLEIFKTHPIDVVITDILMPVMDGVELTRQIKEIREDTPIIILSALNEEPFLKKVKALGIYGYITKPFNDNDFFDIIYQAAEDVFRRKKQC